MDPSVDAQYFAHVWTLLIKLPSVHVICTIYPVPSENGISELGTEALPADYVPPAADAGPSAIEVYEETGIRGRALASYVAGEEYKTSQQVIEEKRSQKYQRKQRVGKGKSKDDTPLEVEDDDPVVDGGTQYVEGEDTDLYRYLRESEGETHEKKAELRDLAGLTAKWGSRLRVRCSDDEIWLRLTGSAHRVSLLLSVLLCR